MDLFVFTCLVKIFSVHFRTSDVINQDNWDEDTRALIIQAAKRTGIYERRGKGTEIGVSFENVYRYRQVIECFNLSDKLLPFVTFVNIASWRSIASCSRESKRSSTRRRSKIFHELRSSQFRCSVARNCLLAKITVMLDAITKKKINVAQRIAAALIRSLTDFDMESSAFREVRGITKYNNFTISGRKSMLGLTKRLMKYIINKQVKILINLTKIFLIWREFSDSEFWSSSRFYSIIS